MIVDDSAVIRGLLTRYLEADSLVAVVSSVSNGSLAVSALSRHDVDVVVLDIEMPVMDGLTALPKLLEVKPSVQIVICSILTRKNAEVSLRALRNGAADYVTKPRTGSELSSAAEFQRELIEKVKALGAAARGNKKASLPDIGKARVSDKARRVPLKGTLFPKQASEIVLRQAPIARPEVIAIGSSTGGPQALFEILRHFTGDTRPPILITQHMPATFTTLLAEHIARVTGQPCSEAKDGEPVLAGRIYIAPGNFHMTVEKSGSGALIRVTQEEPENFCRPSVDPMLRSMAEVYGSRLLVLILTGMGSDGQRGAEVVTQSGGSIIAQDEASSVVWGMPGSVATRGLCSAVLPLNEMGSYVHNLIMRSAA
jgi:two-component system chemotaxis response regulator CheB